MGNEEQTVAVVEQLPDASKPEPKEDASQQTKSAVSEKPETPPEPAKPKYTFNTDEELNAHVKEVASKLAQAQKDRELKPVYEERESLKQKIADLEDKLADKKADRHLAALEGAESETWEEEVPVVKSFQEARRETIKMLRDANLKEKANAKKEQELTEFASKLNKVSKKIIARDELLEAGMSLVDVKKYAEEASEATDEKEFRALLRAIKAEHNLQTKEPPKEEPKKQTHKPDVPIPAGSRGIDLSKLSPKELGVLAYSKK